MNKPLVSILMAAYNAEKYIKAALDSALAQTYPNIEIVVVNDGSTDKTPEIIESYRNDKRVIYFSHPNQGISKTRNKAFELSRGEYITFLDADDLYAPTKVEKEAEFLDLHPEYGVAYCRVLSFYTDAPDVLYHYRHPMPEGDIFRDLLKHQFINPGSVMLRRELFAAEQGFNPDFRDAEDWDLWRRLGYRGVKFGLVDQELHYNRMSKSSLSGFHNQVKMKRMNVISFTGLFSRMSEGEKEKYGAREIMRLLNSKLAVAHLLLGEKREARQAFREAYKGSAYAVFYPLIALGTYLIPAKVFSSTIKFFWQKKHRGLFYR